MKGAFETVLLFFFGMMFTCLLVYSGINFTIYHQARCYQELIVAFIEHHHGYDEQIEDQLSAYERICTKCSYSIYESSQKQFRYQIVIEYPVIFPVLEYQFKARLVSYAILNKE